MIPAPPRRRLSRKELETIIILRQSPHLQNDYGVSSIHHPAANLMSWQHQGTQRASIRAHTFRCAALGPTATQQQFMDTHAMSQSIKFLLCVHQNTFCHLKALSRTVEKACMWNWNETYRKKKKLFFFFKGKSLNSSTCQKDHHFIKQLKQTDLLAIYFSLISSYSPVFSACGTEHWK